MRIEDYPPQEPVPDGLRFFHQTLMRRAEGIEGREYAYGDDPSQSLTIYPCAQAGSPVLLFLHGGGWTNGYKEEMAFLAPPLNAAGFTLVSASYRLAPKYVFPANFDDVADAVAMSWDLADIYGYDRGCLFIGGHSAGGHLASLLAVRSDWQVARGLPEDVLKGCLPISATYDFTPGSGASMRPRFLGPEGWFNEVTASPLFALGAGAPPFFITMASQDIPHLPAQAEKFAMVAQARGIVVDLLTVDDANHATVLLTAVDPDQPWLNAATGWMRGVLQRSGQGEGVTC